MRTMSETGGAYQPTHSDLDPSKPPQESGLLTKEAYDIEKELREAFEAGWDASQDSTPGSPQFERNFATFLLGWRKKP